MLRVCSVPSNDHAAKNLVYVHPSELNRVGCFLRWKGFIFSVATDPAVPSGCIAMNILQRECVGATLSVQRSSLVENSNISEIPIPQEPLLHGPPSQLSSVTIRLEYYRGAKKGGSLDYLNLDQLVRQLLNGQYLRVGQKLLLMPIESMPEFSTFQPIPRLMATITKAILRNTIDQEEVGQLVTESEIILFASERSEIHLQNIPDALIDAQQHVLFKDIDLEQLGIGGLGEKFSELFRRAFSTRMAPVSQVRKMGIRHAKGVLLFGPPGTGKTLLARKIGEILNSHPPKIVNGPELLNKFVGGTEENVRNLFADAETEMTSKGDQSKLHLIIFDEFDALCKKRGMTHDGTGVSDNVVNQLLSKIDGINALNNILLIGMTNRKDLIDEAVLRPGRFEIHIEIGLPDEKGRLEIFRIHTSQMRKNNLLATDVLLEELASQTKNYTGAEIEGVVRSACTHALSRHIDFQHTTPQNVDEMAKQLLVTRSDFYRALEDIPPALGQSLEDCASLLRHGIIHHGVEWKKAYDLLDSFVQRLRDTSNGVDLATILCVGSPGSGKSAFAGHLAMRVDYPFMRILNFKDIDGYSEQMKVQAVIKTFDDAYRSAYSIIILDNIESLIEYAPVGPRFSNPLLQVLINRIRAPPPPGKRLFVIGTTSVFDVLDQLGLYRSCFAHTLHIPNVSSDGILLVTESIQLSFRSPSEAAWCQDLIGSKTIPMARLILMLQESSRDGKIDTLLFKNSWLTMNDFS